MWAPQGQPLSSLNTPQVYWIIAKEKEIQTTFIPLKILTKPYLLELGFSAGTKPIEAKQKGTRTIFFSNTGKIVAKMIF